MRQNKQSIYKNNYFSYNPVNTNRHIFVWIKPQTTDGVTLQETDFTRIQTALALDANRRAIQEAKLESEVEVIARPTPKKPRQRESYGIRFNK